MSYRIKTDNGYVSSYTCYRGGYVAIELNRDPLKCHVFVRKIDAVKAVHRIKTRHLFQPGVKFKTIGYELYHPVVEFVMSQ